MRVRKNPMTPLAAVLAGLLAGAAGTVCLDAVHYLKYRRAGGTDSPRAWEFAPVESWETAPAPGQVAKRVLEGFTQRMYARTHDRDTATTWTTREAQYDAVCTWGIPDHARLQRLSCLQMPVFVANGDSDPMILPHYSYLLAGLIPHARIKIYPDSAHGFLFQHHAEFAADIETFLADANS
jgi:pimeloyl-ACP methyl ester carboxylesterase